MSERVWPGDSADSLSDFSEEIRRRPLLTAEDEIRLGTAVRTALAAAQMLILRFPESSDAVQSLVDQSLWAESAAESVEVVEEENEIPLTAALPGVMVASTVSAPVLGQGLLPSLEGEGVVPPLDEEEIIAPPPVLEPPPPEVIRHATLAPAPALRKRLEKSTRDELLGLVTEGRRAHTALVEANLRLVFSIGRRYARPSYPLEDIVQDGAVGLMRAAWKYDPSSGNRFSTYATWWIRQGMTRALSERSRAIRLPVHVGEQLRAIGLAAERLRAQIGRPPTEMELAHETGIPVARLAELRMVGAALVSLDSPVGDSSGAEGEGNTLGAILADPASEEDFGGAANNDLRRQLAGALADLQVREREILTLRYGLDESGQARTLEEVGKILGITRERVRQIEAKALRKLRHPRVGQRLRDFL